MPRKSERSCFMQIHLVASNMFVEKIVSTVKIDIKIKTIIGPKYRDHIYKVQTRLHAYTLSHNTKS